MPHAFIQTKLSPTEIINQLLDDTIKVEDIIIKFHKGFTHSNNQIAILPSLVVEPHHNQRFYIQLSQKQSNRILLRIDPLTHVTKTVGVRLSLVFLADKITNLDSQASIEVGNLQSYFEFDKKEKSQKKEALHNLRKQLGAYLRTNERRKQADFYTLTINSEIPPFDWYTIFQNSNPVEIEIGPGKGKFILNEAQANPGTNYLAIEWAPRYRKYLADRIPKRKLSNLKLLVEDARIILREWLPANSVSKYHIYYPDPWWKRKHEKHRIFTQSFLQDLEMTLANNGIVCFATDVEEVDETLKNMMSDFTQLTISQENIYQPGGTPPPGRTNFEIKKWQTGSSIFEVTWKKQK